MRPRGGKDRAALRGVHMQQGPGRRDRGCEPDVRKERAVSAERRPRVSGREKESFIHQRREKGHKGRARAAQKSG
ncbi:hypothetical protein NDU88_005997 [Pleurodeles waltl]|uniref:Uncharacterized protein n=1 Tax=Pleurodeles waltl TaxID=8319 RepID=A0AAV7MY12_PLEWA|nr:hypothetical protein NDU88_005997 [Pleurodeles waltl]